MALCSQYCINFTVWRVVLLCATRFQFKNWNFVIIIWLNIEYILMTIFSADEIFECDTLSKNMVEWFKNVTVFLSDVTIRSQRTYCCAYSATKNANGQNLEAKRYGCGIYVWASSYAAEIRCDDQCGNDVQRSYTKKELMVCRLCCLRIRTNNKVLKTNSEVGRLIPQ